MVILVNKQTNDRIPIAEITFVIGRGSILQVNEKKVSRNHGIINVLEPDGVINIKSTHPNPIFYKQQASIEELKILQQDQDVTLSTGDLFGLLETELWFEIAADEQVEVKQEVVDSVADECTENDRPPVASEEPTPEPTAMEAPQPTDETPVTSSDTLLPPARVPARRIPAWMVTQSEAESSTKRQGEETAEQEMVKRIKVDPDGPSTSGVTSNPQTVVVKTEPSSEAPSKVAPADSSTRRPSCNFGVRCYRKRNIIHAAAEAHPGDLDYRRPDFPPAPADASPCPYGASCYRRNPQHFREFSHPDSSIYFTANLQQQILNNKRRRVPVSYTVHVNIGGDISDDDDSEGDFQASDDDEMFDPNKTEPEDSDEDDTQPVGGEDDE